MSFPESGEDVFKENVKFQRSGFGQLQMVLFKIRACVGHGLPGLERCPEHLVWARLCRLRFSKPKSEGANARCALASPRCGAPRATRRAREGRAAQVTWDLGASAHARGASRTGAPFIFSFALDSRGFIRRQSTPGMEQLDELELLMEKSFGEEAAPPAEL